MLSEKSIVALCKNAIVQKSKEMLDAEVVSLVSNIDSFQDLCENIIVESICMNGKIGISQKYICTLEEDENKELIVHLTRYHKDIQ